MWDDAGTGSSSAGPNTSGVLENSQCRLHMPNTTVAGAGNTLTVVLDVSFKAGYFGARNIYAYGMNSLNTYSTPAVKGTWTARSQLNTASPSPAVLGQTITLAGVELGTTGDVKFTTRAAAWTARWCRRAGARPALR